MNGHKKNSVFIMRTKEFGGAQKHVMDLFRFIDYSAQDITWAVRDNVFSALLSRNNLSVNVSCLPCSWGEGGPLKRYLSFYRYLKSLSCDRVIFSQFWLISFSVPELLAAHFLTKGNVYMIIHDCPDGYKSNEGKKNGPGFGFETALKKAEQRLMAFLSKKVIAVSNNSRDSLVKHYKYPERKISVAYHGVDVKEFAPSCPDRIAFRRNKGIPETGTVIVSTSRLARVKRIDRILQAFGCIAAKRKDVWLVIAGQGDEYENLYAMSRSFGSEISARILFLGFHENVAKLLAACDVYVLASESEGFAIAGLEAMATGLVCIFTDSGGPSEYVNNGINGFIVEKSFEGVLSGLNHALSLNETEKNEISRNAIEFTGREYQLESRVKYLLELLGISGASGKPQELKG